MLFNNNDNSADKGNVVISNEVIASIAANAAKDVDGFGSFAARTTELGKNSESSKAVKVWRTENDVKIQININVKSGVNIQAVSTDIQNSVKSAVQGMTGKVVSKVNVAIQGIDFCEPTKLKA